MNLSPKLLLGLAFTLSVGVRMQSQTVTPGQLETDISSQATTTPSSVQVDSESSAWVNHWEVTRYATAFDGDHSLEAATVAEQAFAGYTLYTVRLKFTSGKEQSLAVVAPPGGLQPEMRDMSGDSVPNDLVLSSRLLRSPQVVMLNNGHDQLTMAISPGAFAPGEGRATGPHEFHRTLALMSYRFKAKALANREGLLSLRYQESRVFLIEHLAAEPASNSFRSGRAPPAQLPRIQFPS